MGQVFEKEIPAMAMAAVKIRIFFVMGKIASPLNWQQYSYSRRSLAKIAVRVDIFYGLAGIPLLREIFKPRDVVLERRTAYFSDSRLLQ